MTHLWKTWVLDLAADGVRLGNEAEAKTWLDSVIAIYAQRASISLSSGGAGGTGGGGNPVTTAFLKLQADQHRFAASHIELYMRLPFRRHCI